MIGLKVNVSFWILQISPKARSDVGEENYKFTYFWFSVLCGKLGDTVSELEMNFFRLKPWYRYNFSCETYQVLFIRYLFEIVVHVTRFPQRPIGITVGINFSK